MSDVLARRNGGFTLVESLVALTLSTGVIFLAAGVFFVQNDFNSFLVQESKAQDNARSVLRVAERELGSVARGGLVSADSSRMVLRVPLSLGGVCAVSGPDAYVHWADVASVDASSATGLAVRDSTAVWTYQSVNVGAAVQGFGAASAGVCAVASGADTVGAQGSYSRVGGLGGVLAGSPAVGEVVMVYEEVELSFSASTLDPTTNALYRGPASGTLTEYATGIAPGAKFLYRVGTSWVSSASSSDLNNVDAIRIVASSVEPAETARGSDATFTLSTDVVLRNR